MASTTLTLTSMANGGTSVGRDENGRPVFVPYTIPTERVAVEIFSEKASFARANLLNVLEPASSRVAPVCPHFTTCGGCHFQHIIYEQQLLFKEQVIRDQLKRIGGLTAPVLPILPHPAPWQYRYDISLSPTPEGELGFWAPRLRQVIPIEVCHILHPRLMSLWQDIDLELPGLRKLTLRLGENETLMAALETNGVEPPSLETDFPISVALVLPDKTAVSLVGDFYIVRTVREQDFRISPGCAFPNNHHAATMLVDTLLHYAALTGTERVLDAYSGVGLLTAFLAQRAETVVAIEQNSDAVADTTVNLHHTDNVTLYQGNVEEVLPTLNKPFDLVVVHPTSAGLSKHALKSVAYQRAPKLIYVSNDVATFARDGKLLQRQGYHLVEVQPIDSDPQTFHTHTLSLWQKG